jgi:hypothetical protein
MAFEHFAVRLNGLAKVFAQPVTFRLIGVMEQFTDQSPDSRQMIVTGTPPGHVIQKAMNLFGDPSAFGLLQTALADDIIDKVNAFGNRTLADRHA